MTDSEKISYVRQLVEDTNSESYVYSDDVITLQLSIAKDRLVNKLYPFGNGEDVLPTTYDLTQCELAMRQINRIGVEGEKVHIENGIHRTYDSVDDTDILDRIVPFAKLC